MQKKMKKQKEKQKKKKKRKMTEEKEGEADERTLGEINPQTVCCGSNNKGDPLFHSRQPPTVAGNTQTTLRTGEEGRKEGANRGGDRENRPDVNKITGFKEIISTYTTSLWTYHSGEDRLKLHRWRRLWRKFAQGC